MLDVGLPGRSGLDFQDELAKANLHLPVIFISGHADVPMSVRAMKAGAVEFLTKPVRDQDLLDAIHLASRRTVSAATTRTLFRAPHASFGTSTLPERKVRTLDMTDCLADALLNQPPFGPNYRIANFCSIGGQTRSSCGGPTRVAPRPPCSVAGRRPAGA